MSLVYAGVVPHAPLLLPTVAKEHQQLLETTRQQLVMMAQEIHARQVEVLVILTPHGTTIPGSVSVDVADSYHGVMTDFGDVQTKITIDGAVGLAHRLKEIAEKAEVPIALQTAGQLDYGTTVPLFFFYHNKNSFQLIPLSVGGQTMESLLRFGTVLNEFFHSRTERFGLIASADLERRKKEKKSGLTAASAQRPTPLERRIAEAIVKNDVSIISTDSPKTEFCGLAPIITLLASLQTTSAHGQTTSFEAPFGVGQMTATIEIPS